MIPPRSNQSLKSACSCTSNTLLPTYNSTVPAGNPPLLRSRVPNTQILPPQWEGEHLRLARLQHFLLESAEHFLLAAAWDSHVQLCDLRGGERSRVRHGDGDGADDVVERCEASLRWVRVRCVRWERRNVGSRVFGDMQRSVGEVGVSQAVAESEARGDGIGDECSVLFVRSASCPMRAEQELSIFACRWKESKGETLDDGVIVPLPPPAKRVPLSATVGRELGCGRIPPRLATRSMTPHRFPLVYACVLARPEFTDSASLASAVVPLIPPTAS